MIDLNTGGYFGLNQVAAAVWTRLAAGEPLGTIIDALQAQYAVEAPTLERDVFRICSELVAINLLRGPQ